MNWRIFSLHFEWQLANGNVAYKFMFTIIIYVNRWKILFAKHKFCKYSIHYRMTKTFHRMEREKIIYWKKTKHTYTHTHTITTAQTYDVKSWRRGQTYSTNEWNGKKINNNNKKVVENCVCFDLQLGTAVFKRTLCRSHHIKITHAKYTFFSFDKL